jgi:hypothetical protein
MTRRFSFSSSFAIVMHGAKRRPVPESHPAPAGDLLPQSSPAHSQPFAGNSRIAVTVNLSANIARLSSPPITVQDPAAEQCWIEHQTLNHVKEALRITLSWKVGAVGLPRKLSSIKFTLKSFQRHLARLMKLEEEGGYMAWVGDEKPSLLERTQLLEGEHESFRRTLAALTAALDELRSVEELKFAQTCQELEALLQEVDLHDAKEIELIQEALLVDEGGEG